MLNVWMQVFGFAPPHHSMKKASLVARTLSSALIALSPMITQTALGQSHLSTSTGKSIILIAQNTQQDLPSLRPGSRGQAVLVLQIALKQLGYYNGLLDGVFEAGFLLSKAVQEFQSSNGMLADGMVGPGTWRAILSRWSSR